jgi:hypothetical protein
MIGGRCSGGMLWKKHHCKPWSYSAMRNRLLKDKQCNGALIKGLLIAATLTPLSASAVTPAPDQIAWRAVNVECCSNGPSVLTVTIAGVTRSSTIGACGQAATQEGFAIVPLAANGHPIVSKTKRCAGEPIPSPKSLALPFTGGQCYEIRNSGGPIPVPCQ